MNHSWITAVEKSMSCLKFLNAGIKDIFAQPERRYLIKLINIKWLTRNYTCRVKKHKEECEYPMRFSMYYKLFLTFSLSICLVKIIYYNHSTKIKRPQTIFKRYCLSHSWIKTCLFFLPISYVCQITVVSKLIRLIR